MSQMSEPKQQRSGISIMSQSMVPQCVLEDLDKFISEYYEKPLPHPLIISQAFCLRFKDYGKSFGMPAITCAIEHVKTR